MERAAEDQARAAELRERAERTTDHVVRDLLLELADAFDPDLGDAPPKPGPIA